MHQRVKTYTRICSVVLICCVVAASTSPQPAITVRIDMQNPGVPIPHDFAGLSFENSNLLRDKDGTYQFSAENKPLIALFRVMGVRNLRVGGGTADGPEYGVPGPEDIDHLFAFAKDAAVKVIYTFRLLNGNPAQAAELARYIRQHYDDQLSCFEIGNEPDWHSFHTFPGHPRDPKIVETDPGVPGSAYPSFLTDWKQYAAAVIQAVPDTCLAGPDTGSNYPVPGTKDTDYNGESWSLHFAHDTQSMNVKFVTQHDYPGQSAAGVSVQTAFDSMLSPSWPAERYSVLYSHVLAPVEGKVFGYRMTECNDYTGGVNGASNTFVSALWALDYMHWQAAHHAIGLNFHNKLWIYTDTVYRDELNRFKVRMVSGHVVVPIHWRPVLDYAQLQRAALQAVAPNCVRGSVMMKAKCGQRTGRFANRPFHRVKAIRTICDMSRADVLAGRYQIAQLLLHQSS